MQKNTFFDDILRIFEQKWEKPIMVTPEQEHVLWEIALLIQKQQAVQDGEQVKEAFKRLQNFLPSGSKDSDIRILANQCLIASMIDLTPSEEKSKPVVVNKCSHISKDDYIKSLGRAFRDLKAVGSEVVGIGSTRELLRHRI